MNDLAMVWHFTRVRLNQAIEGLNTEQMSWQPYEGGHTIFNYLYHVAGVEYYWVIRLLEQPPANEFERKLEIAARDGFLREAQVPFNDSEDLRVEAVRRALDFTFERFGNLIENLTETQAAMPSISPIGDPITGKEGLVRVAQHAGYHTGQIWLMRMDPRFPKSG